jgi:hypothetical protein
MIIYLLVDKMMTHPTINQPYNLRMSSSASQLPLINITEVFPKCWDRSNPCEKMPEQPATIE